MSETPVDYEKAVDVPVLRSKIAMVLHGTAGDDATRQLLSDANQALARFDQPQARAEIIPLIDTLAALMVHAARSISVREWEVTARVLSDAEVISSILARIEPAEPPSDLQAGVHEIRAAMAGQWPHEDMPEKS